VAPGRVWGEVARVLRPGGLFHFKTPNKWHYVSMLARITPHWFHEQIASARGRRMASTFETYYKANTIRTLRQLAAEAGLVPEEVRFVEWRPEYCRLHPVLYACGIAYERLVNSAELFAPFRVVLVGSFRKPA
jgi:hypothetical protein